RGFGLDARLVQGRRHSRPGAGSRLRRRRRAPRAHVLDRSVRHVALRVALRAPARTCGLPRNEHGYAGLVGTGFATAPVAGTVPRRGVRARGSRDGDGDAAVRGFRRSRRGAPTDVYQRAHRRGRGVGAALWGGLRCWDIAQHPPIDSTVRRRDGERARPGHVRRALHERGRRSSQRDPMDPICRRLGPEACIGGVVVAICADDRRLGLHRSRPRHHRVERELELYMKRPLAVESASALIDEKIKELGDWRGKTLAKVRKIIHEADPEIVEEWKWMETPVWSHGGLVCTGETYKNVVKMTFAKGAAMKDPSSIFNASLEGNVRRAIDIHEGDKVDEVALKDLIRAAVALNLEGKGKPKLRRASSKRAD